MRSAPEKCCYCGFDMPHLDPVTQKNCMYVEMEREDRKRQREGEIAVHNAELYWALRTRILTDEEFEEVRNLDYHLLTRPYQGYKESEVQKTFNDALMRQFMMRQAKREVV